MATSLAAKAITMAVEKRMRELHGVVVSSGLMDKTVKVRVGGRKWNNFVKKYFNDPKTHLVHDPNNSLRTGDVVAIQPGWRVSKSVRHVVNHIIAPAHVPIDERPPVPTVQQRWQAKLAWRERKDGRRRLRKIGGFSEWAIERAGKVIRNTESELIVMGKKRLLPHPLGKKDFARMRAEVSGSGVAEAQLEQQKEAAAL